MRSSELRALALSGAFEGRVRQLADSRVALVSAAVAVGLALRFYGIGQESFWLDEAGRAAIAALPLGQIPSAVGVVELSPPLYHFILRGWMQLFGSGDVAVRALSAVLVIPTVPLAWSVGDAVGGRRVGAVTAVLAAVNPFAVYYGREAAMYALLLALSLATLRAAMAAQMTSVDSDASALELRKERTRGLAAYVVFGALALYTHYYAAFLLASVAAVGVTRALMQRSRHGVVLWVAAHCVIALAFLPWVAVMGRQVALAASVPDWSGVDIDQALMSWSGTALADAAPGWESALAVVFLLLASALGAARLRWRSPSVWLVATVALGPLVAAALTSAITHSFRERGLMVAIGALWVLLAAAIAGRPRDGRWDGLARGVVASVVAVGALHGVAFDLGRHKEDWRQAARILSEAAAPNDPLFFVHFGSQLAFDRYFAGPQPQLGLPDSFRWDEGYTARFVVTPEDADRVVPPALAGRSQAWAILSHDQGRGSEYLLAALDRWGTRASDTNLDGVRVVRFVARAGPHD